MTMPAWMPMPVSTATDPNAEKRQVGGARPVTPRRKAKPVSKSTGPVSGRKAAQNPGRSGTYGKTAPGGQPTPARGRPDGVRPNGQMDNGSPAPFKRVQSRGKPKIG